MGLSLLALEQPAEATDFLTVALRLGINEDDLNQHVLDTYAPLYILYKPWHPGGLQGFIADLHKDEEATIGAERKPEEHSLLGHALPIDSAANLKGGSVQLEQDGVLVIDLWATWCGPCVAGMPHLQQVASDYSAQGVRVVGVSVDEKRAAPIKFFKGAEVDYELGWVGKSGLQDFDVQGIPSLFVVDHGVITDYISGYGGHDTRLEEALDRVLAAQ